MNKQQNKTVKTACKTMALCALTAGVALSAWGGVSLLPADAAGKVTVKPYVEYLFDTSDTLFENTGTSASDTTKDYTLQKHGNAAPNDLCYGGELNLEDNGMLTLSGENNPFANGALTDFTLTMQAKTGYSSWYSAPVSWDSLTGDTEGEAARNGEHRYTRVTAAAGAWNSDTNSGDADWMRFTDTRLQNLNNPHWESYGRGQKLYEGDRTAADSGFVTLFISVDADSSMTVQAYKGADKEGEVKYNLTGTDWRLYEPDDTDKVFTLGGAWDSRNDHIGFKIMGRIDNVRIYDFAMTEAEIAAYTMNNLNHIVDGVEIDPDIVGGTITVDKETPGVGETVTITPTPEEGAELKEITVDGVALSPDANGEYKTTMKEGGIFVSASFLRSLPVEIGNVANGTVVPDKTQAKVGEEVRLTVTPNSGYGIKKVLVNGLTLAPTNGVYVAEMTDEGMLVTADFAKRIAVTVASDIKNGTLTPNKTECFAGERITFTVTPDEGYEIEKVLVNGEEIEADYGVYAVIAEGDINVSVAFKKTGGGCKSALSMGALTALPLLLGALTAAGFMIRRKGEKK